MPKKTVIQDVTNCKSCGKQLYRKGGDKASQKICWVCLADMRKKRLELLEGLDA